MFFHVHMTRHVTLHPAYFGQNFQQTIERKLRAEVEGQWTETYGYVIYITEVISCGKGKVQEETGHALFVVKFTAQVFKPFRNEVLDAIVTQTNAYGFFANVGPVKVFVPDDHMPGDYQFDATSLDWFNADGTIHIKEESRVRLSVIQVKSLDGFCLGSIKDDFMGLIELAPV